MIRSLKTKRLTSSACSSNHRSRPLCSVSTLKSAIQALDRLDPVLPLSPGRAERHGFEYYRHGTLSLYGALNTQTGEVLAKTSARHTSKEFVDFLAQIVASQPAAHQIHVVADNLSGHKTKSVFEFLEANPAVRIHYTPTYSSWLNQVENLVFQDSARRHFSRCLHFCKRSGPQAHALHPQLQQNCDTDPLDLQKCCS